MNWSARRQRIAKGAAIRVCLYGGLCLIAVVCFVDVGALFRREPVQPSPAAPATPDAGWPHLRGPHYDAHSAETGLADSWPAEGPPVLWNREIGAGYSGLIVVGNRAYTQAQSLTSQEVLALDADTGRTIWQHKYEWPYDPGGMYPGPHATPTFADGRIYFASPDGLVGCLRADDGQPLWSLNVKEKFGGRGTDFGYSCSPLVEDGKVFFPVGGPLASMVALNADTGATVWASGSAPASYCSAIPIAFHGRRQVIALMQNVFAGFDLETGRLLWQQSCSSGYDEHATFPLYDEPFVRTTQPFRGGSDLYQIEETRGTVPIIAPAKTGLSPSAPRPRPASPPTYRLKLVRHDTQMSNDVASSVLVGGHAYGFDLRDVQTSRHRPSRGQFRCLNFKTGETCWSSDRPGHCSILAADGKLLLFTDRGEILLIQSDPTRYQELARTEIFGGEICWTAPSLDRGRLYVRSPTRAACLFVGKPEQMSRRQRELAMPTSSIPKTNRIELGWLLGGERECPFELPDLRELWHWYVWSLAAIAAAWSIGAAVGQIFLSAKKNATFSADKNVCTTHFFPVGKNICPATRPARIVFWQALLTLGMAATPVANRYSGQFVLTWPLALFTIHQLALASILWSRQPQRGRFGDWAGAAGALLLTAACFAYYAATRSLSLAPAWYFLLTFLPAWPVAVPAAHRLAQPGRLTRDAVWMLAAFTLYFWLAGGLLLCRAALGR